jgi:glycerate kinase
MALLAGAGLRLPLGGALAPFAEVRLQQGLTDVTQPVAMRSRIVGASLVVGARF